MPQQHKNAFSRLFFVILWLRSNNYTLNGEYMKNIENHIAFSEYPNVEVVRGECIHSFPTHIHENLCLGLITQGRAAFCKQGKETLLSAGDAYSVPPYTPHSLSSFQGEKFSYTVLCFKHFCVHPPMNSAVAAAKRYIEGASSNFSIDNLATALHVSKSHLNRLFKAQIGITPYHFYIKAPYGSQSLSSDTKN